MVRHNSDSSEQQLLEKELIKQCALRESTVLVSKELTLKIGTKVQIDGFNEKKRILCEAFAHRGSMKPGQKRKLGSDILKLIFIERRLGGQWRKIICVPDDSNAKKYLEGPSWVGQVISEFEFIVDGSFLTEKRNKKIEKTQIKQGNPQRVS